MITFKEFLEDPIPINKAYFLTRKEYYKRFMQNSDPKEFYDQLVKIEKEKMDKKKIDKTV